MNFLINPYKGTDSRIDEVYDLFQMEKPNTTMFKNECVNGVCKLSTVKLLPTSMVRSSKTAVLEVTPKMLPLNYIKKEIIKISKSISTLESKPKIYIFAINREDMDIIIAASKNWNKLTQNRILKIILIDS
jgi:hypothetical protein